MRTAIILAVVFVGTYGATIAPVTQCTSNAFVCRFNELGQNIKEQSVNLGNQLSDISIGFVNAVVESGTDLIIDGSKVVLDAVNGYLSSFGKRQIISAAIGDIAARGTRYLQNVGQQLKNDLKAAVEKLVSISSQTGQLLISETYQSDVDTTVGDFATKADNAVTHMKLGLESSVQQLLSKGKEMMGIQKRGISDSLASATQAVTGALKGVTDALTPHVQAVVGQVASFGQSIKVQTASLVSNVQQSLSDLSDKLNGHVTTLVDQGMALVQHGKDGIDAVKDAVSQIAAQTMDNAVGTLKEAVDTSKEAVGVITNHISG